MIAKEARKPGKEGFSGESGVIPVGIVDLEAIDDDAFDFQRRFGKVQE